MTDHSDDLIGFLQRYAGYCLTGLTHEHVFVFAHGTGGNGKGTLLNTVSDVLGDYATVADTGTFIASRWERHPADLAHLVGARLVVAQETQEGRRWNEALIKQMTGGDTMSARFMRQDYFTFKPSLSRRAMIRKPSCLISWIQPGPEGGAFAGDGRHGSIIPKPGRVRSRNDIRQCVKKHTRRVDSSKSR